MNPDAETKETEKMMEGIYRYIGYQYAESTAKELDQIREMAKNLNYPKELDEWFYDYCEKSKRAEVKKKRRKLIRTLSSRVAMILLVLSIGMTMMPFSLEAFRIKFLNLIMNVTER